MYSVSPRLIKNNDKKHRSKRSKSKKSSKLNLVSFKSNYGHIYNHLVLPSRYHLFMVLVQTPKTLDMF